MEYRVADHGISYAVLPVQPAEDQAEAAVEEEAAEQDQGSNLAEDHQGGGEMAGSESQGSDDIRCNEYTGGDMLPVVLSEEELPDHQGDGGHEEQPQHYFFNDAAIQNGGDDIAGSQAGGVGLLNAVNEAAEYPVVKAAYDTAHNGNGQGQCQVLLFDLQGLPKAQAVGKQIAEEADRLSREVCSALLQHVINS